MTRVISSDPPPFSLPVPAGHQAVDVVPEIRAERGGEDHRHVVLVLVYERAADHRIAPPPVAETAVEVRDLPPAHVSVCRRRSLGIGVDGDAARDLAGEPGL